MRWTLALGLAVALPAAAVEPVDRDEAAKGAAEDRPIRAQERIHQQGAAELIRDWPDASRQAAERVIDQYGEPEEATASMLVWRDNGPWKRTIVRKEPVAHRFPTPHEDVLEQVIDYQVPPEYADDLALFDGSVHVYRTAGELAASCDSEAMNFLALNLADDIVKGDKTVAEARLEYGRAVVQHMAGDSPDLTQGLQFRVAEGQTAFRDEAIIQNNRVTNAGLEDRALQPVDLEKGVEGEEPALRPTPTTRERRVTPEGELEDRIEEPRTDEERIAPEPEAPPVEEPIEEDRIEPF